MPGCLFQRLAGAGLDQGFALFEVPGGLVVAHAAFSFLFDQKEAAIALDDGGNGDIGFPETLHGKILAHRNRLKSSFPQELPGD